VAESYFVPYVSAVAGDGSVYLWYILNLFYNVCRSGRAIQGMGLDYSDDGSWVRLPFKAWMFVLAFLCGVFYVGRGFATGSSTFQGVLPNVSGTLTHFT
jgi:hypothetical protein